MRQAKNSDFGGLSDIYYRAVDIQLRPYYDKPQIDYYLKFARDRDKFGAFIFDSETWVVEHEDRLVGFGGLEQSGHITSLYVDPDYSRQGIASLLLEKMITLAEERSCSRIFTEANPLSKSFFQNRGFVLLGEETRVRNEVPFIRFNMEYIS